MDTTQLVMQHTQIGALLGKKLDLSLSLHGINFTEFSVMYHLLKAEGATLSRISLAEKVVLTASGVTRVLLPMEKNKLVQRKSNPRDARQSLVTLTEAGHEVVNNGLTTIAAASNNIFSLFDEEELTTLMRLLNKLKC